MKKSDKKAPSTQDQYELVDGYMSVGNLGSSNWKYYIAPNAPLHTKSDGEEIGLKETYEDV